MVSERMTRGAAWKAAEAADGDGAAGARSGGGAAGERGGAGVAGERSGADPAPPVPLANAPSQADAADAAEGGEAQARPRAFGDAAPATPRAAGGGQLARRQSGSLAVVPPRPEPGLHTTCGGLLNQLRAMINKPVPVVVIAGASEGAAAYRITEGLADAARRSGLRLLVEELIGPAGRPLLQQRAGAGSVRSEPAAGGSPPALPSAPSSAADPRAERPSQPSAAAVAVAATPSTALEPIGTAGSTLTRWFEHSGGSVDFIAIAAPALDTSVEAALLARACDGLVIIVESEVTPRESLHRAVKLARASGCRLLGLVMSEPKPRLPSWWRRLVNSSSYRGTP